VAGVVRVTRIITRLLPWSRTGTIHSGWRSRAGFVNRRTLVPHKYVASMRLLMLAPVAKMHTPMLMVAGIDQLD
jgi:hypothetical protein